MMGSRKTGAKATRDAEGMAKEAPQRFEDGRSCGVCGVPLSAYNGGPNCYRHSAGVPWRGPSARPKID